jgi:hypothetical protein
MKYICLCSGLSAASLAVKNKKLPWNGKPAEACPVSRQREIYGNSIAVPCLEFILGRMDKVEKILRRKNSEKETGKA